MSAYELVDIYLTISTKQDALWALFFSVHLALFGGIIYVDRPLKRLEKFFATIAYGVFALINFYTLKNGQQIIANTLLDLQSVDCAPSHCEHLANYFKAFVDGPHVLYQTQATLLIHFFAAVLAIIAVVTDQSLRSLSGRENAKQKA